MKTPTHKVKHYVRVVRLEFRGSAHYRHGGTWLLADRFGAGDVTESFISCRQQEMISVSCWVKLEQKRLQSLSPKWQTSSTSHTYSPRPQILVVPLPFGGYFISNYYIPLPGHQGLVAISLFKNSSCITLEIFIVCH